jgi:predicted TIM-barrel fold metal-dependent hydrolase
VRDELFAQDYQPHSELVVAQHHVPRAKFPVVDAHNHITYPGFGWDKLDLSQTIREMDLVNVATIVNLSGETGDVLKRNIEAFDVAYPGRFATYCNVDFTGVGSEEWMKNAAKQVLKDAKAGARGLKIYKELGLHYRDQNGQLVMPDDPRLDDIWDAAGESGLPVTIHVADPVAFFKPLDRFNERWDELHAFPDWHFYGSQFPSFMTLIEALYHAIEKHPKTNFITAHVGCYPENLAFVSQMMDRYQNFYTDIAARIAELGRAPYTAREWFLKYPDRILFGTDYLPTISMYQTHFRFLETADEYFEYDADSPMPTQGRWRIYGLSLPDEVLRKVYYDNAARLLHLQAVNSPVKL